MVSATNSYTIKSFFNAAGLNKATKGLKKLQKTASKAAIQMNRVLGGRTADRNSRAFGQNLSAISNRLGFMAFQWKFMAGAAQQAMNSVIGGLKRIIVEGAKTGDAVVRALAFASPISELSNMTTQASKDMQGLNKVIRQLGSGKTIFGMEAIAGQALELQKAFDDLDSTSTVLPFVAKLKTIDPTISDEKLGTGLVSLFAALDIDTTNINEVAKAMDFLSNVSDKSTANFQSSIASIALAAQQAKTVGFVITDLGSIIQTVSDDLGKNKGGGRASGSAGRFANAFLQDLNSIADATTKQGSFARSQGLDIFTRDIKTGVVNFKEFIPLIDVFRKKLDTIKGTGGKASFLSQLGFGVISQQTLNVLMAKTTAELEEQNMALLERGTLFGRANLIEASGQSQILRIQAAISSVKVSLVQGFRPALKEIADIIAEIAGSGEFISFIQTIGQLLANEIIPHVQTLTKAFKAFFNFLKKNPKLLKTLVAGVILLTGALIGLVIISTIGFFALVTAASIGAMGGQMFLAAGSARILAGSMLGLFRSWIPFILLGAGAVIIATALTGVFDESLVPAIVALGAAMTLLGGAMMFPVQSLKLLKFGFAGLGGILSGAISQFSFFISSVKAQGFRSAFSNMGMNAGLGFKDGLIRSGSAVKKGFLTVVRSLGKGAGPFAIAAVAIILIAAFVKKMEEEVENSTFFKTGLSDKWQQVGFRMTAATNVFLRKVGSLFVDLGKGIGSVFADLGGFIGNILNAISNSVIVFFASGFNMDKAGAALREGIEKAFGDFDLGNTLGAIFDPTGVTGALDEIRNSLGKLQEAGFERTDIEVVNTLAEILDAFEVAPQDFGNDEILSVLNEIFGSTEMTETIPEIVAATQEQAEVIIKSTGIQKRHFKIVLKETLAITDSIKIITTANKELTKKIDSEKINTVATNKNTESEIDNTLKVDENTTNVIANTKTIIENIEFLSKEIIAIAKNTNVFTTMTEMMLNVNVMWARLIAQGNRAAGKLASLKVSSEGVFSIRDPGISKSDAASIAGQQLALSSFLGVKELINIQSLTEQLSKINTTLTTANTTLNKRNDLDQIIELQGNRPGETLLARLFNNENGTISVDLKVDSTIDVVVQQGGLSEEDIQKITIEFGDKIADQLAERFGVQV